MDQLPWLGNRELICPLSFTCNYYVVSVRRGFLFLWVLGMGCVILLWHSLSLPFIILYHGGELRDSLDEISLYLSMNLSIYTESINF